MQSQLNNIGGEFSLTSFMPFVKKKISPSRFFFPASISGKWRDYFECGTDAICAYIKVYWQKQGAKVLRIWIPVHFCGQTLKRIKRILKAESIRFSTVFYNEFDLTKTVFAEGDILLWNHLNRHFPIQPALVKALKKTNAFLIEDYVLAPFDIEKMVGDAAFNSLRKVSPLSISVGYSREKIPRYGYVPDYNDLRKKAALMKSVFERKSDSRLENAFLEELRRAEMILEKRTFINGPSPMDEILFGLTDWNEIFAARKKNYQVLKKELKIKEQFILPGGYQFLMISISQRNAVRKGFFREKIYPPIHWIDSKSELRLSELSLPVDQRYGSEDMKRLSLVTNRLLSENGN